MSERRARSSLSTESRGGTQRPAAQSSTSTSVQLAIQTIGVQTWICKIDGTKANQPYWFNTQDRKPQFSIPPGWNTPIEIPAANAAMYPFPKSPATSHPSDAAAGLAVMTRASSFDVADRPQGAESQQNIIGHPHSFGNTPQGVPTSPRRDVFMSSRSLDPISRSDSGESDFQAMYAGGNSARAEISRRVAALQNNTETATYSDDPRISGESSASHYEPYWETGQQRLQNAPESPPNGNIGNSVLERCVDPQPNGVLVPVSKPKANPRSPRSGQLARQVINGQEWVCRTARHRGNQPCWFNTQDKQNVRYSAPAGWNTPIVIPDGSEARAAEPSAAAAVLSGMKRASSFDVADRPQHSIAGAQSEQQPTGRAHSFESGQTVRRPDARMPSRSGGERLPEQIIQQSSSEYDDTSLGSNGSGGSDIYKTSKSVQLARQMAGGRDWICKIDRSRTNQPYWFNTQDRKPQFSPPPGWNTPITIHGGSANEAQEVTAADLSGFERASSFDVAERPQHSILAGSQFVQSNQNTSSGNARITSMRREPRMPTGGDCAQSSGEDSASTMIMPETADTNSSEVRRADSDPGAQRPKSIQLARQTIGSKDWVCKIDRNQGSKPYWFNTRNKRPQFDAPKGWNTPIEIPGEPGANRTQASVQPSMTRASTFSVRQTSDQSDEPPAMARASTFSVRASEVCPSQVVHGKVMKLEGEVTDLRNKLKSGLSKADIKLFRKAVEARTAGGEITEELVLQVMNDIPDVWNRVKSVQQHNEQKQLTNGAPRGNDEDDHYMCAIDHR